LCFACTFGTARCRSGCDACRRLAQERDLCGGDGASDGCGWASRLRTWIDEARQRQRERPDAGGGGGGGGGTAGADRAAAADGEVCTAEALKIFRTLPARLRRLYANAWQVTAMPVAARAPCTVPPRGRLLWVPMRHGIRSRVGLLARGEGRCAWQSAVWNRMVDLRLGAYGVAVVAGE
jgi:hypothetical protein